MSIFLGAIKGKYEDITPALDNKIRRYMDGYLVSQRNFEPTRREWNKAYDMAIREFGYKPADYKRAMRVFDQF